METARQVPRLTSARTGFLEYPTHSFRLDVRSPNDSRPLFGNESRKAVAGALGRCYHVRTQRRVRQVMKRREFVSILGGATLAWPITAFAQQRPTPVIGYLGSGSPEASATDITAFRKGLSEMGYAEGRNIEIEFRWTQTDESRLPELAADLVRRRPAVIAAFGTR